MSQALASHAASPMSEIAQRPRPQATANESTSLSPNPSSLPPNPSSATNATTTPTTTTTTSKTIPPPPSDTIQDNAKGAAAGIEPLPVAIVHGVVDKQSLAYVWRSGVAGGLAGCAAKTVVAPLDRVKILFQASNPQFAQYSGSWAGVARAMNVIYRQDGFLGLYRGHSATLLRIFPYAAVKFLAYEQIRSFIIPRNEHETPLRRLLSGALAGVTSVFVTYPLEVVRVRLAFETRADVHSNLVSICRRIYFEQPKASPGSYGLTNFYRGFSPTILGMLPYAGMSFLTHDTCGDLLRHPVVAQWTTLPQPDNAPAGKPVPLRSWAELLAGAVAGLVSQTASYPLEVVRRRMQVGGAVGDGHRLAISETARLILRERGFRGFFVGLTIGYVKVLPMSATSFYTYERFKQYFGI